MITITTQGKTYQIVDLKGRIKSTIEEWIRSGFLEEVKENKDSILEKLRNGLEKRKQKMLEENWGPSCIEQVVWTLAVLDSLETKEETVVNYCDSRTDDERARDEELQNNSVTTSTSTEWTPTPGHDTGFNYARQPQEDIELQKLVEIGDFDYMKITDGENYKFATLEKQVEALTKSNNTLVSVVNQLIKANKK